MRTEKEMLEYASKYNGKVPVTEEYFRPFAESLHSGEEVLFCCAAMSIVDEKESVVSENGSAVLITDRRILLGGNLGVLAVRQEIPLSSVKQVTVKKRNFVFGAQPVIETKTHEEYRPVLFDARFAQNAAKDMNKALDEASRRAPQMQISPAEEIRRLKELLDEGIITEEEFTAGKKKLLGME